MLWRRDEVGSKRWNLMVAQLALLVLYDDILLPQTPLPDTRQVTVEFRQKEVQVEDSGPRLSGLVSRG